MNLSKKYCKEMSSINEILTSSFQQYSIIWLLISAAAGAFITSFTKYLFEHTLPEWQIRRATKFAIEKYSFPLLRSAYNLDETIRGQVFNSNIQYWNDPKHEYYRLRVLYFFGAFFGWCRILSNESLLELVQQGQVIKSTKVKRFVVYYDRLFKGISNTSYFIGIADFPVEEVESARIPALVISCIGELMIGKTRKSEELFSNVISFLEFTKNFDQNPEFKRWFSHLENLFVNITPTESNSKWNRIIIFYTYLCVLIDHINRNNKQSFIAKSRPSRNIFGESHRSKYLIIQPMLCRNIHPEIMRRLLEELSSLNYTISYKS